jgi:hypothetical protein
MIPPNMTFLRSCGVGLLIATTAATSVAESASASDYASIQEALDRNPGRMVFLPVGDYTISAPVRITSAHSGLWGPGRIVQTNPAAEIVEAVGAAGLELRNITLTRADGHQETTRAGLSISKCPDAVVADVQVLENWGNSGAFVVADSARVVIRGCVIRNYSRISIDDRTKTSFLGYAFNCIDGTGLVLRNVTAAMVTGNRVIEQRMRPTPELKAKYALGHYVKKNAVRGWHVSQQEWDANYRSGWHQGAAMSVNSGESSDYVQIRENYIENAAQGFDIHADHVILANNLVNDAFVGMKAVHGSRNTLIIGNQFSKNSLWSIGLMPGTATHEAGAPTELSGGRKSGTGANLDGYSIIASNIISDFGFGTAHWNWDVEDEDRLAPLRLGSPGFAAEGHPPLRDVVVQDNMIYDTGRDQIIVDGKPRLEPPRYKYAVKIATGQDRPPGLLISHNVFHPGTVGVTDTPFTP